MRSVDLPSYLRASSITEARGLLGGSYDDHGFPDLYTPLSERNYMLLRERGAEHEAMLVNILRSHGVSITEFSSVDEFRRSER